MIVPDKERGQAQGLIELSLQMPSNERIDQYKQMLAREGVPIAQAYLTALDEIERLRKGLSFIRHIIDDPYYSIRDIQEQIDRLTKEGNVNEK